MGVRFHYPILNRHPLPLLRLRLGECEARHDGRKFTHTTQVTHKVRATVTVIPDTGPNSSAETEHETT
jgi:hypothetical protein